MKFKIHQKDLVNTLNILDKALPSKTIIESLKGIKIDVTKDHIQFTTSKSDMSITHKLTKNHDIEIINEGTIIVSGSHLINIVKKLDTNYINFEKVDNTLHIKTNKSRIELIEYDKSTYPIIVFDLNNPKEITINKELLQRGYNKTKYSISNNQLKQVLTGMHFDFQDNRMKVESTDSLRMSYYKTDFECNEHVDFTIGKNILQDIISIFDLLEDEEININFSNNQIVLKADHTMIKAKLIDGEFPKIENLIPTDISYSYEIDAKELIKALERVVLLTDKNESVVIAEYQDNNIKFSSFHKFLGGIEEICTIKNLTGSPFKIAFDPQFIIDSINTFESEDLKFEFVDEISAFTLKQVDSDNIISVISPIRIV